MSIVIYFEIIKITSIILLFFNWEIVKGPINPDHKTKSNIFQANKKKMYNNQSDGNWSDQID